MVNDNDLIMINDNNDLPILRCFKIECFQNIPCLLDTGASKRYLERRFLRGFLLLYKISVSVKLLLSC